MAVKPAPYKPWLPATYARANAAALQALLRGEATPHQQKLALDWIIEQAARTYDTTYFPDSDRDSAFAEGKRFVGNQIIKMLKLNLLKLNNKDDQNG